MTALQDITNKPHMGYSSDALRSRTAFAHLDVGFSLLGTGSTMSREMKFFFSIYPGTRKVSLGPVGITLTVDPLPLRPHPITVADIPLHITDDQDDFGYFQLLGMVRAGPEVLPHLNLSGKFSIPPEALDEISAYCDQQAIPLRSISSIFGNWIVGALERYHAGPLPRSIGRRLCRWKTQEPGRLPTGGHTLQESTTREEPLRPFNVEYDCPSDELVGGQCLGLEYTVRSPPETQSGHREWVKKGLISICRADGASVFSEGSCGTPVVRVDSGEVIGLVGHHNLAANVSTCSTVRDFAQCAENSSLKGS